MEDLKETKESVSEIIKKLADSLEGNPALVVCLDGENIPSLINMGNEKVSLASCLVDVASSINYRGVDLKILILQAATVLSKIDQVFKRELGEAVFASESAEPEEVAFEETTE